MKKSIKIIIALAIILLAGVGIIIGITNSKNSSKISIVASNFPAYDFARAITEDQAEIKMLVKPGAETHDFEPTPEDIINIKNSNLFIYTGGESDEWIEDILNDVDSKTKVFKMMDAVSVVEEETVEGMEEEHEAHEHENHKHEEHDHETHKESEYDEHVWTSLKNATKIIDRLKDELIKISPENEKIFIRNAKNYTDELKALDSKFQEIVDSASRKTLIFGDRFPFRYFVDDYGLNYYAAFPGCSDQTEASSKTIAFLIDKVRSENIPVVLKIEMGSGKLAETISKETGTKVLTFNSAHNISNDDFKNGKTYAKIMAENSEILKEALK